IYSGEDKYFPPKTRTCLEFDGDGDVSDSSEVCVSIINFENGDKVPMDFRLAVEVSSAKDVEEVKVYIDGNKVTTDRSEPWGYNFELGKGDIGRHTFRAVAVNEKGNEDEKEIELEVTGYVLD
ncbi:Ig-like domain-containing protein, partial [Patescibacteria group bacterium]